MTDQPSLADAALLKAEREAVGAAALGQRLYDLAAAIYPICRSLTGQGVRETLAILGRHVPFTVHEVPTGTPILDWTVPREWNVRDAWVKDEAGRKVVDFQAHNLHLLGYSVPLHRTMTLDELKPHLFTLPKQPDLIPYRTSYWQENWGFCMRHDDFVALPEGRYEVFIDTTLADGHMTYGEYLHRGQTKEEVVLTAHICHPSLANDNCSGLSLLTHLAAALQGRETRYSYRFLLMPGTVGAITWLARNRDAVANIRHGMALSCVGDGGGPVYKKSRQGDAPIDEAMAYLLGQAGPWAGPDAGTVEFSPYGYDERQFCSPGFNLPFGLLQRSRFGRFPAYHTSADDLSLITPAHLASSYRLVEALIDMLEHEEKPVNLQPFGEPQLGRRGLYDAIGGQPGGPSRSMAMLWVLNLADGEHSLLDMAKRSELPFTLIKETVDLLRAHELLAPAFAPLNATNA